MACKLHSPILLLFVSIYSFSVITLALNNGLALKPPMGFLIWERFRCNRDCINDPDYCIGERVLKQMADVIATEGYKEAGYEYVIIDDCWMASSRAPNGQLVPEPTLYSNGIKPVIDYVHSLGLKFGIYAASGRHTCEGYPGSKFFFQLDMQTFADWGVDYLKLDVCDLNAKEYDNGYPPVAFYLNKTGRPIVFGCSYPIYQMGVGSKPNVEEIAKECNLARIYNDILDSWDSVLSIINYMGKDELGFSKVAGPGYFNDPDEVIIGNFGLSYEQERTHIGMWAILAAPLLISADIRQLRPASKALLLNERIIAINQDQLGIQGTRIQDGDFQIWTKPILPTGSFAFALFYTGGPFPGFSKKVSVSLKSIGLVNENGYKITEVFDGIFVGKFLPNDMLTTRLNPSGIFLATAIPI